MSNDLIVAHPDMKVTDAARVILRSGIQRLPVVDDADNLVGIISNTDVVRSQIERATPSKVGKLMRTLEQIHGVKLREERREVRLTDLTPTQARVYADELEGRKYELKRGLAEPLVVIDNGGTLPPRRRPSPRDGGPRGGDRRDGRVRDHHRSPVELGMAKTAKKEGLDDITDIEIVDYARHPLVETTKRLQ